MGSYVNFDGISDSFLGFMGYVLVAEDELVKIYVNKGTEIIVAKNGPKFIFVEDDNDVQILRGYRRYPSPPWN
jgi:hypothetical protein